MAESGCADQAQRYVLQGVGGGDRRNSTAIVGARFHFRRGGVRLNLALIGAAP